MCVRVIRGQCQYFAHPCNEGRSDGSGSAIRVLETGSCEGHMAVEESCFHGVNKRDRFFLKQWVRWIVCFDDSSQESVAMSSKKVRSTCLGFCLNRDWNGGKLLCGRTHKYTPHVQFSNDCIPFFFGKMQKQRVFHSARRGRFMQAEARLPILVKMESRQKTRRSSELAWDDLQEL